MSEVVVELDNVSLKYGDVSVFEKFNLQIRKGEILGVTGRSGRGKTTLLRIIADLQKPDSGKVIRHNIRTAYVFQDFRLLPWMTALENTALVLVNALGRKRAEEKASTYLDLMQLAEFKHAVPSKLSGGMIQRVSIARALAFEPDVLLLDEPLSALDIGLRRQVGDVLKDYIERRNVSVVCVSHQLEELTRFAGRILEL